VKDPLAGYRKAINERKVSVLRYPASEPCPVGEGQFYKLQSCVIEIERPHRKIVKGKPAEWHVTFIRHEQDRVNLLRQSPPVHATGEQDASLNMTQAERARRDGNYTSTTYAAMPHEPESVGPDWQDKGAAERELKRQESRRALRAERDARDAARLVKAQGARVILESAKMGRDITPLLADIFARLKREADELDKAA
jgi:phage protein D